MFFSLIFIGKKIKAVTRAYLLAYWVRVSTPIKLRIMVVLPLLNWPPIFTCQKVD